MTTLALTESDGPVQKPMRYVKKGKIQYEQ